MDAPRRWQVASLATAVTGLGIGALLLGRPVTEPAAPIDLLVIDASATLDLGPDAVGPDIDTPATIEIVRPGSRIVGDTAGSATAASPASTDSPDGPSLSGSGSTSAPPAPAPAPSPSPDSPSSVDSPSSADSDD